MSRVRRRKAWKAFINQKKINFNDTVTKLLYGRRNKILDEKIQYYKIEHIHAAWSFSSQEKRRKAYVYRNAVRRLTRLKRFYNGKPDVIDDMFDVWLDFKKTL